MKRRLLLTLLGLGLLLLALGGWAVQGLRWAVAVPLRPRVAVAASVAVLPLLLAGRPL